MDLSEALLAALGWQGPAMVEYRFDPESGTYWLMEVNGRFWGSIPLAWHCGAHFAWESYRCGVLGEGGAGAGPTRQRRARYVIPDAKRTAVVLQDGALPLIRRLAALGRFFLDFFDPRVRYYVWSLRDPGPLFGDLWGIVKRPWQRDSA
jgi:predicted ATP-grasp superfamily ATP-dependent carboligase